MRIIIECPENILHLEAEYICADCPFVNFNPLAVRRRTIHFANWQGRHPRCAVKRLMALGMSSFLTHVLAFVLQIAD